MKPLYSIRDWKNRYESSDSRKVKNTRFVCVPNKHDGKSYRRLLKHPRAVEIFCAWNLILQVASKCPDRGILADEDGPLDAEDLHLKTGFPEEIFEIGFAVLSSSEVGWLDSSIEPESNEEVIESGDFPVTPGEFPSTSGDTGRTSRNTSGCREKFPTRRETSGGNRTEENKLKRIPPPKSPPQGAGGGGGSDLSSQSPPDPGSNLPPEWRKLLTHFKINAPPVPVTALSGIEPELAAHWIQVSKDKQAGRGGITNPWSVAKTRHQNPEKFELAADHLRMVKKLLNPVPLDKVCPCGEKLEEHYCAGSGQSTYSCSSCGKRYEN